MGNVEMRPQERVRFLVELARVDFDRLGRRARVRAAFLERLRRYVAASGIRERMPEELSAALAGDLSQLKPTVAVARELVEAMLTKGQEVTLKEGTATVRLRKDRRGVVVVNRWASLREIVLRCGVEDLRSGGVWVFAKPLPPVERCPGCQLPYIKTDPRSRACSKRCRRTLLAPATPRSA